MATYTEPGRDYAFLLCEGPGTLSREKVTLLQDATNAQPVVAGTVLGMITASGKYTPYDDAAAGLVGVGATVAAGILAQTVDPAAIAAGDVTVQIIKRFAEVKSAELTWHTLADATADSDSELSMDIFRDYFTREALLASIAKVQYVPGKFAPWFESRSLNGTIFALEDVPVQGYNILADVPRGTPSKVETLVRRAVHTFNTKHYRVDGAVYADEVLNMRGQGVANAVDIIQQRRDETMAKLRRDIDMTHESLRLACILTPDNAFGSKPADVSIARSSSRWRLLWTGFRSPVFMPTSMIPRGPS